MNLNRKILASAISSLLLSTSAFAVVDLNANTGASTFATEIDLQSAVSFSGTALSFTSQIGAIPASGADVYVRYVLSAGAGWNTGSAATMTGGGSTLMTPGTPAFTDVDGDSVFETMIVGLTPGTSLVQASTISAASPGITVNSSAADISIEANVFETLSAANNSNNIQRLSGPNTGVYMKFAADSVLLNPTIADNIIDVSNGSKQFEGGATLAKICEFDLGFNGYLGTTSVAVSAAGTSLAIDSAAAGSTLVFSGDFSAAASGTAGVFISTGTDCSGSSVATTADISAIKDTVTFAMANKSVNKLAGGSIQTGTGYLCLTVDGSTVIPVSQFSGQYESKAASGFIATSLAINCAKNAKGGSSAVVPMLLNGEAPWNNYIRITNPSNVEGTVFLTAYNDAGVAGGTVMEFSLKPGESTGIINGKNIINTTGVDLAVADTITGVVAASRNKLRLSIDAEFGQNGTDTGVIVRTYSLASDKTSFSQFD